MLNQDNASTSDVFIRRFKSMFNQKTFNNNERLTAQQVFYGELDEKDQVRCAPFHVITSSEIWLKHRLGNLFIIPTKIPGTVLSIGLDENNEFELGYENLQAVPYEVLQLGYGLGTKFGIDVLYTMLNALDVTLQH